MRPYRREWKGARMILRSIATAAVLALVTTPGLASAGPIVTAALERATFLGEMFNCRVVNAGTATANVTIELVGAGSGLIKTKTGPLPGGYTNSVTHSGVDTYPIAYCRVTGIARRDARVALSVLDLNHTVKAVVTAP
jgi:hypothetical protein